MNFKMHDPNHITTADWIILIWNNCRFHWLYVEIVGADCFLQRTLFLQKNHNSGRQNLLKCWTYEFSTIVLLSQHSESVFDFSRSTLISSPWGMISRFTFCPVPIDEYRCDFSDNSDGYSDRSHSCCVCWWIFNQEEKKKPQEVDHRYVFFQFQTDWACLFMFILVN